MKNILIIGGSKGIGLASCELLSNSGYNVFGTYKNTPTSVGNIQYFPLDVNEETYDFGSLPEVIDGLVYCPGLINLKPFARIKPEDFLEDYKIQVLGAIKVIQQILPRLKKSNSASIVLFSTVAVQTGFSFHSLVASSKGAVEGLTKALSAEFAPAIRVNCIAPSITETPLAAQLLSTPEKIEANAQRHPLKKIGKAEDLANAVKFLIGEESAWMTGQILAIDGGISSLRV
ncbi:SDR family oxidoreductase [Lacihabitans sp. LS3-19]|uniref:SDR family NAD(P)-dependent oxidoreductase n=1 Tax=Lacihabitans sp. LS3-19 TaxID=2487335 RepID=UPI0020CEAF16|nr:SDR family oxidoreductase [Lacihabitans sp. LS3-19]MCP9766938.1 SDR family oxidoreductase [Lacihabitans sp. LS3-19]